MSTDPQEPTSPPPSKSLPPWLELACVAALALAFFGVVAASAWHKSLTPDEELRYSYGKRLLDGDPRAETGMSGVTPVSMLNAWTLRLRASFVAGPPTDGTSNIPSLWWARLGTMLIGAALVVVAWGLARLVGGPAAGLLAAWFCAFCPNLMSHSMWVTNDIAGTLGFTLGLLGIVGFLRSPTSGRLAWMALAIGLAQPTKLYNVVLFGLFPLLACIDLALDRRSAPAARAMKRRAYLFGFLATLIVSLLVLHLAYRTWPRLVPLAGRIPGSPLARAPVLSRLLVPLPARFLAEIELQVHINAMGHPAYFHGEHGRHGWIAYFPSLLLFKTPLPLLGLWCLGTLLLALHWTPRRRELGYLALPPLLLLGYFTLFVHLNIGIRYVLPVYPPLMALGAACVAGARRARRQVWAAALLLAAWQAAESLRAAPHQLGYFNQLMGGPNHAWKWFNDSNLDWWQDNWYVLRWAETHPEQNLRIHPPAPEPGLIAVSVNSLTGLTPELAGKYRWLRENYEPEFFITPAWPVYRVADDERLHALRSASP